MEIEQDDYSIELNEMVDKFEADDILHCIDDSDIKSYVLFNNIVEPSDFDAEDVLESVDEADIAKYMQREFNGDFSEDPIKICVNIMRAYSSRFLSKEDLKKEICEYIDNVLCN